MRHILTAIMITIVLATAGFVDRQWHQDHWLVFIRSHSHLISVGAHEFGIAEYSFRGIMGPTSTLPDPRGVILYFGPFGTMKLSKLLLVAGVAGTLVIGYRLLNTRARAPHAHDA